MTGRYLLVNDPYCEILGRTRQELLDARIENFTHPDDLPKVLDAFIQVIETGTSLTIDQRYNRADGSCVWVNNSVSVGRDAEGKPQYVLAITQDITAWKETERALNRTQADLRLLLDSAADGFYCVDRDGKTILCNPAFLRMLGFAREEDVIGRDLHDTIHHSRADGSPYPKMECPIYRAAQYGIHAHVTDEVFFRLDGKGFPVEYRVRPIVRNGEITGAVCTFVDVTERKNANVHQELLNRELGHRVKNTLAIAQAIVGQTLRNSSTPQEAIQSVSARLFALSHAHSLLTHTRWGNASIVDVIEGATAIHSSDTRRIQRNGPRIDLGTKSALAITMALHELCTNAAKYGALSNDVGTVSIAWTVTGGAADARFRLSWKECNGPPVAPPSRKGFGSRVIAESFGPEFGGEAKLIFNPGGVLWTLDVPLMSMKM